MDDGEVSLNNLAGRVMAAVQQRGVDRRYVVGITGPPAAGKSTLSVALSNAINAVAPSTAEIAPMDGFHLTNEVLRAEGATDRKGEPDTFDIEGFLTALKQLRSTPVGEPVSWPAYERTLHDPVPGAITFTSHTVAIVEGNYLLLNEPGWGEVATHLDDVWYLDAGTAVIEPRLLDRHLAKGKSLEQARRKVTDSDLQNARLIARTRDRADLLLRADNSHYVISPSR
ncbi:nucleoside/nucleotide kinase family protein [Nocardia sp. NPDC050710]|uniref:nucleoside/nucleotide kinase family protein n=1 Tax=Nocardia sp. NPDC050710 TaxID=3157220 RepID=UPI0033C4219F